MQEKPETNVGREALVSKDKCHSIHPTTMTPSTLSKSPANLHNNNLAETDRQTLRPRQNLAEKRAKALLVVEGQVRKQPRWNQRSSFSFMAPASFFWATLSTSRSLLPPRFPPLLAVRILVMFFCFGVVVTGNDTQSFFCRRRVVVGVAAGRPTFSLLGRLQEPADHDG